MYEHIAAAHHHSCTRISAKVVRMIMIESKIGMVYKWWRGYTIVSHTNDIMKTSPIEIHRGNFEC